jgi:hypothetical protein
VDNIDTDADLATAIWEAQTASYGGAGSYGLIEETSYVSVINILNDTSAMDTAAECRDLIFGWALATDYPSGAPAADCTVASGLSYLYGGWRNKTVTNGTNSEVEYYNDAGTKVMESDISDDGTDFERGEIGETKRRAAISAGIPFIVLMPVSDGTISQGDRQMMADVYPGILAGRGVDVIYGMVKVIRTIKTILEPYGSMYEV